MTQIQSDLETYELISYFSWIKIESTGICMNNINIKFRFCNMCFYDKKAQKVIYYVISIFKCFKIFS